MENKWLKNKWIILLLAGILLVVAAIPSEAPKSEKQKYASEEEEKLECMLQKMKGVGRASVMITYQNAKQVEGVLIIADGAGNASVVKRITEVVQALFPVDSHKIKVIEQNQNN